MHDEVHHRKLIEAAAGEQRFVVGKVLVVAVAGQGFLEKCAQLLFCRVVHQETPNKLARKENRSLSVWLRDPSLKMCMQTTKDQTKTKAMSLLNGGLY